MPAGQKKEQVKDIYKNKIASILKDSTKLFSFTDGLVSSEADLFASAEKQVNAGYVASKTKSLSEVIKADDYNRMVKVACEALINQALIYDLSTATKIDKSRPEIEGEVTHDKDDPKNLCGEYLVFEDIKYDMYCPPKNKKPCSKLFQTEEEYYQYVATRLIYSDKLGCKNLKIPDDYYLDATFFEIRSKLLKALNWEPALIFKIAYWIDGISTDNLNHQRDEEARKLFDQLFSGNIALQQQAVATIREKDFITKTGDIAAMYFESEFGGYIVGKLGGLVIKSPFFKNIASYVGSKVVSKGEILIKAVEENGFAIIRGSNNEVVGKAWLGIDDELNMTIVTKGTSLEKRGREVFKELFRFINSTFDEIKSIRGTWRSNDIIADNLKTFNENIKSGLLPNEAALKTYTGKMALEHNFLKANVLPTSIKNVDGTYKSVDVIFTK